MDDLLPEFIAETRETLEALSGEIVAWEADPTDRARLDAIFRFVHTVKGSCGFLDLPRLQRLSHAAEDVLAQVRAGERAPSQRLVDGVLAVVDRISELIEAMDRGASLDAEPEDMLIAALGEDTDAPLPTIASAPVSARTASRSVRLSVDLLDRMMSGMSDMVLARNDLARRLRDDDIDPAVEAALERMSATVADLRDTVTRTRMQKLDTVFSALPRMVRDISAGLDKQVSLTVDGADVELDREMIEVLRDPLVHILRNAIDHGIEHGAERRAAGKREQGRLTVAARQSGNQIMIEIADDGRGVDVERVIAKLVRGGADERQLRALPHQAKLALIFEPGLSTRDDVTEISGRGVGMDVVRSSIEQIGGRIDLDNMPGRGLRLAIHLPLTLSIISAIVLGAEGQRFAITRQAVEEIVSTHSDQVRIDSLGGVRVVTVRDRKLPFVDLGALLGLRETDPGSGGMLAIITIGEGSFALAVDSVLDHEELVIKPAAPCVMRTGLYAGQTLPDSGLPMLLLDAAGIAAAAQLNFGRGENFDENEQDGVSGEQDRGMDALMFVDLDGRRRAVPLSVVDRIEQVDGALLRFTAGRLRITLGGQMIPVAALGDTAGKDRLSILRLSDGLHTIAYAVTDALDIVTVTQALVPAPEPGPIMGATLFEDMPLELIDPHWLFETHGAEKGGNAIKPACLILGRDDGWLRMFVRPLLEQAGYRVVTRLEPGEKATVVLCADGATPDPGDKVIHVRADLSGGMSEESVYRYDRAGLLAAVAARLEEAA